MDISCGYRRTWNQNAGCGFQVNIVALLFITYKASFKKVLPHTVYVGTLGNVLQGGGGETKKFCISVEELIRTGCYFTWAPEYVKLTVTLSSFQSRDALFFTIHLADHRGRGHGMARCSHHDYHADAVCSVGRNCLPGRGCVLLSVGDFNSRYSIIFYIGNSHVS